MRLNVPPVAKPDRSKVYVTYVMRPTVSRAEMNEISLRTIAVDPWELSPPPRSPDSLDSIEATRLTHACSEEEPQEHEDSDGEAPQQVRRLLLMYPLDPADTCSQRRRSGGTGHELMAPYLHWLR